MNKLKSKLNIFLVSVAVMAAVAILFFYVYNGRDIVANNLATENFFQVSFEVESQTYNVEAQSGATVLDAMQKLSIDSDFSFAGKEFSGLGYFVEEINGVKGNANQTWIYYVNGVQASVGVSQYILRSGDIISWKYEEII